MSRTRSVVKASGAEAGPSTASRSGLSQAEKVLPDFMFGTYEAFLRACEREMKIGLVVLVSEEHSDVPEFKRTTLTDPTFVDMTYDNNILAWGGDVRTKEAWSGE